MARKGVVKNGDAFCLECNSPVDRDSDRCGSCDAILDEEAKAFSCPRCNTVLPLGIEECPQCSMKFRIKTLRQKLAPWGKEEKPESSVETDVEAEGKGEPAETVSPEQLLKLKKLVENIDKLADSRAELLSSMKEKHKEEKLRLAELKSIGDSPPRLDLIESEVVSLADEISDLARLHGSMRSIVDEISTLVESFDISDEARAKGLAAKAMMMVSEGKGIDTDELNARENQLRKREEMVDRKIRGYASKRKELEDKEANIAAERKKLDKERDDLEQARKNASAPETAESPPPEDWMRIEAELSERIRRLCDSLPECEVDSGGAPSQTINDGLSAIEGATRKLVSERTEDKERVSGMEEQETEMKQLLKTLDQLLGQLPEDAIQRFTQSDDYKLYERVLDRYKI